MSKRTVHEWEAILQQRIWEVKDQKDIILQEAIRERDYLRRDLEHVCEGARQDHEEARQDKKALHQAHQALREEVREGCAAYLEILRCFSSESRPLSSISLDVNGAHNLMHDTDHAGLQHNVNNVQLQAFFNFIYVLVVNR